MTWNSVLSSHRDVIGFFQEPNRRFVFDTKVKPRGIPRMASAEDFRRYAAECVALAQRMSDPADKAHMMRMAQAWRDLADRIDNKAAGDRAE